MLTEPIYTPDVGTRLRLIEENGLILKKLETYDVRYRDYWDAYEWAVPTGGHGLTFKNPKLVVTFNPDRASSPKKTLIKLPAKIDIVARGARLRTNDSGGEPTAIMPSPDQFTELAQRTVLKKPAGMSDWEFQRVTELYRIGGDSVTAWTKAVQAGDYRQYEALIRDILAEPPRYWKGWGRSG